MVKENTVSNKAPKKSKGISNLMRVQVETWEWKKQKP